METTRENLPAMLRLGADVLREPAFCASEFEQLSQRLASLEEDKSEPQASPCRTCSRTCARSPRTTIRYIPTVDESIGNVRAVTLDDATRFYWLRATARGLRRADSRGR